VSGGGNSHRPFRTYPPNRRLPRQRLFDQAETCWDQLIRNWMSTLVNVQGTIHNSVPLEFLQLGHRCLGGEDSKRQSNLFRILARLHPATPPRRVALTHTRIATSGYSVAGGAASTHGLNTVTRAFSKSLVSSETIVKSYCCAVAAMMRSGCGSV
jgi:hypothetical protein